MSMGNRIYNWLYSISQLLTRVRDKNQSKPQFRRHLERSRKACPGLDPGIHSMLWANLACLGMLWTLRQDQNDKTTYLHQVLIPN